MKRLIVFARSIIPEDPAQLFFLGGSVLLLISMQLRCFPVLPNYVPGSNVFLHGSYEDPIAKAFQSWLQFSVAARLPIVFAGAAGLFICFWPGAHPVRRILVWVCFPAIAGFAAICGRFLYLAQHSNFPYASVFQRSPHTEAWFLSTVWTLGPAVHISVLGIASVFFFLSRLAMGITSLPLSVAHPEDMVSPQRQTWRRAQVFIWISIAGSSVIGTIALATVWAVDSLFRRLVHYPLPPLNAQLLQALAIGFLAGIAAWAIGENRWKEFRQFTRLPEAKFGILAVIFSLAISQIPNLAAYTADRIYWAAFEFERSLGPTFASYFYFPDSVYFWLLFGAAFEEIIWRGYLQPRFVQRYGITRGIFLVGVAWSASHFLGDFVHVTEDYQVLLQLVSRLGICIAMSYVLGWLTLRSASIWPAALAHGIHNVWALSRTPSSSDPNLFLPHSVVLICWGLLGFALFRFWPPSKVNSVSDQVVDIGSEPAD